MPRSANLPPMEESPLVSKPSVNNSTIHPEKMEQSRFSELRNLDDEKTNPLRIVIYAVIVIAIGVGAVFLVRSIVSNNQSTDDQQQDQTTDENIVEDSSAFSISLTPKSDTTASNLASNDDYVDSSVVTLGDSNLDMTQVELTGIRYERYTTFARTTFDFEGNSSTLPKTNINFDSVRRELTVSFEGLVTIAEELKSQKQINDIVRSIRYNADENQFVIIFGDDSKYRVFQSSGNLSIDVKTLDELEKPDPQEPVAQDNEDTTPLPSTTPPSSSGNKPAAPYYENSYSQNRQYISSNVKTNSIAFNNYWVWDQGTFFEFSLGINNSSGDDLIPNATSYYEEEDDKIYLVLEIENLTNAPFSISKTRTIEQLIQDSGASISPAGVNFKMVELVSFTNGKATYRLEVKTKSNYSLLTQVVEASNSQIVSLRIQD